MMTPHVGGRPAAPAATVLLMKELSPFMVARISVVFLRLSLHRVVIADFRTTAEGHEKSVRRPQDL